MMFKSVRAFGLLMVLILISVWVSSVGLAAGKKNCRPRQDPAVIANQLLDRLQAGYQTANIPLIVSLYHDPVVMVDVTRDQNKLSTAESSQAELEAAFLGLTGIKCDFRDRQISAAGDMIMIRTYRVVTANEIPVVANCLLLMVLQRSSTHRQPLDYVITSQIILKEEYLPKSENPIQQDDSNNNRPETLR